MILTATNCQFIQLCFDRMTKSEFGGCALLLSHFKGMILIIIDRVASQKKLLGNSTIYKFNGKDLPARTTQRTPLPNSIWGYSIRTFTLFATRSWKSWAKDFAKLVQEVIYWNQVKSEERSIRFIPYINVDRWQNVLSKLLFLFNSSILCVCVKPSGCQ